ncbi:MAG: sigma-E processing peptidase SpoIIGA [Clostridia bacterium]|nr:sigma-E processing peptidase SpoIIGA [Clostridia bacterium]MBR5746465.1 sigma-E processing peptidase SpoIIGA [Clostridia bacterium]
MYEQTEAVYADVLFLINFCADFIALFIAGRLCGRAGRAGRLAAAAALGGMYSFVPLLLQDLPAAAALAMNIAAGAAICALAFGIKAGIKKTALTFAAFAATEALLGGLVSGVYGLAYASGAGGRQSPRAFACILALAALAALFYGLAARRAKRVKTCGVRIFACGEEINARLIVDSGNLVTEPFSALPVIVLSHTALPYPLSEPQSRAFPAKLRVIPYKTANGAGCLYGFRPDKAELTGFSARRKQIEAFVGIDTESADYSGYDGILPAELL